MDEGERLGRLVERLSNPERGMPVVSAADAATIAGALHDEVDSATTSRADHAAEQDLDIACASGCNACCANLIMTYEAEAMAVAVWLDAADNHPTRDAFLAAYPKWHRAVARSHETGRPGDTADAETLMREVWEQQIMCAFNRDGACSIYPARPTVCRVAHALETAEHCSAEGARARPPAVFAFVPLDRLLTRTKPLWFALHVSLGGDRTGATPLCDAVYRLLDRRMKTGSFDVAANSQPERVAKVGRNDPCPCGSGNKHKRCCGR